MGQGQQSVGSLRDQLVEKLLGRGKQDDEGTHRPLHLILSPDYLGSFPSWFHNAFDPAGRFLIFSPYDSKSGGSGPVSAKDWENFFLSQLEDHKVDPWGYLAVVAHLPESGTIDRLKSLFQALQNASLPALRLLNRLPAVVILTLRHYDEKSDNWVTAGMEDVEALRKEGWFREVQRVFLLDAMHPKLKPITSPEEMFDLVGNLLCLLHERARSSKGSDFVEWITMGERPEEVFSGYTGVSFYAPVLELLEAALDRYTSALLRNHLLGGVDARIEEEARALAAEIGIDNLEKAIRQHLDQEPPDLSLDNVKTIKVFLEKEVPGTLKERFEKAAETVAEYLRYQAYYTVLDRVVRFSMNVVYGKTLIEKIEGILQEEESSGLSLEPLSDKVREAIEAFEHALSKIHHPSGIFLRSFVLAGLGLLSWSASSTGSSWLLHWGLPVLSALGILWGVSEFQKRVDEVQVRKADVIKAFQDFWQGWFLQQLSEMAEILRDQMNADFGELKDRLERVQERLEIILDHFAKTEYFKRESTRTFRYVEPNQDLLPRLVDSFDQGEEGKSIPLVLETRIREWLARLLYTERPLHAELLPEEVEAFRNFERALLPRLDIPRDLVDPCGMISTDDMESDMNLLSLLLHPFIPLASEYSATTQNAEVVVHVPSCASSNEEWKKKLEKEVCQNLSPSRCLFESWPHPMLQIHVVFPGLSYQGLDLPRSHHASDERGASCSW